MNHIHLFLLLLVPFLIGCTETKKTASYTDAAECAQFERIFEQTRCYHFTAVMLNDGSICGSIVEQYSKQACQDAVKYSNQDMASCLALESTSLKGECLTYVAIRMHNPAICQKIPTDTSLSMIDGCYSALAQVYHDKSYCENVPDTALITMDGDKMVKTTSRAACIKEAG